MPRTRQEARYDSPRFPSCRGPRVAPEKRLLGRLARLSPSESSGGPGTTDAMTLVERMPALDADDQFKILITNTPRGTIPARVWRAAHVIYFDVLAEERSVESAENHKPPGGRPDGP